MAEVQPLPFIGWALVSAAVFAAVAFAYNRYLRKKGSTF